MEEMGCKNPFTDDVVLDETVSEQHYLIAHDDGDLDIEHPGSCPIYHPYSDDPLGADVIEHDCLIGAMVRDMGLGHYFFNTTSDPAEQLAGNEYAQHVEPGRYVLNAWTESSYSHEYGSTEYDHFMAIEPAASS